MKRFLAVIAVLYILVLITNAIPQTYNFPNSFFSVSFDMNTSEKLNVTINPTENGITSDKTMFSSDSVGIKGESGNYATIMFVFYLSAMGMNMSNVEDIMVKSFRSFGCADPNKIDINNKFKIDGKTGTLISGSSECHTPSMEAYLFHYNPQLIADPGNSINCFILSTFPWDRGTRDLLNTIRVDGQHVVSERIRSADFLQFKKGNNSKFSGLQRDTISTTY